MKNTIELIAIGADRIWEKAQNVVQLTNDCDVSSHSAAVAQADRVELHFPAFTDGRAFSQAVQLRKRLGYSGDIRATGDVLIDQLAQMQRSGFSSAVLREDQSAEHAAKLLAHYSDFYQGDVTQQPAFVAGKLA
jgi:uncharacterized protein (DUF934 family)